MKARIEGVVARRLIDRQLVGQSDRGATMVEYGIMVSLIAVVCIVVITTIGADVRDGFRWVEHRLP